MLALEAVLRLALLADERHSKNQVARAAAQAMAESYTAMVSGVLLGMSEALQQGSSKAPRKK